MKTRGRFRKIKKFGEMLYESALLQNFREDSGTHYLCKQSEIDFHQNGVFDKPNEGPFVSLLEATEEVIRWNDEKRAPSREESESIQRLVTMIREVEKDSRFGPDLLIKTWVDLDRVFFAGRLRGHVLVRWVKRIVGDGVVGDPLGITRLRWESETGKCLIEMSAEQVLLPQKWRGYPEDYDPVISMFGNILHEMCHAYKAVRSPKEGLRANDVHGSHFQTKISVVHNRATRLLGIVVIRDWEKYKQHHFLPLEDERLEGEKGQKEGTTKQGGDRKRAWIAIASAMCVLLLWLEVFGSRDVPRVRGGTAVKVCDGTNQSVICIGILVQ